MIDKDQKIFSNIGSDPFAVYYRVVEIANILKVEDAQPSKEQSAFLQAVADWWAPEIGDTLMQKCLRLEISQGDMNNLKAENFLSACKLLNEFKTGYVNLLNCKNKTLLDTLILNQCGREGSAKLQQDLFDGLIKNSGAYCNFKKDNDKYKKVLLRYLNNNTSLKYHLINNLLFQSDMHNSSDTYAFSKQHNMVSQISSNSVKEEHKDVIPPHDNLNERTVLANNHYIRPKIGEALSFLIDSLHPGITYDHLYYKLNAENYALCTAKDYFKKIILFLISTDIEGIKCINHLPLNNPSDKFNFRILLGNVISSTQSSELQIKLIAIAQKLDPNYIDSTLQNNLRNCIQSIIDKALRTKDTEKQISALQSILKLEDKYIDSTLQNKIKSLLILIVNNASKVTSGENLPNSLFAQNSKTNGKISIEPKAIAKIDDIILEFLKDEKTRRESKLTQTWFNRWFSNDFAAINYDLAKIAIKLSNTKALQYFLDDGISPYFAVLTNRNPLRLNLSSNSESDKLLKQYGFFTSQFVDALKCTISMCCAASLIGSIIYASLFPENHIFALSKEFILKTFFSSDPYMEIVNYVEKTEPHLLAFPSFTFRPFTLEGQTLLRYYEIFQGIQAFGYLAFAAIGLCITETSLRCIGGSYEKHIMPDRTFSAITTSIMFCINMPCNCINFISNLLFSTSARDADEQSTDLHAK